MPDEKPPPLEDEDAFYRRVSRRLEADTDGPTPSQAANRRAVLNTMGASKVSEDGEIEGLDSMTEDYYGDPDLDRRVEERGRRERERPEEVIRPLKFTDDPAMFLRSKIKRALE